MRTLPLLSLSLLLALGPALPTAVSGQEHIDRIEVCSTLLAGLGEERLRADWDALRRSANEYISQCSRVMPDPLRAAGHLALVEAQRGAGRDGAALDAADACLRLRYRESGCHLERLATLLDAGRLAEVRGDLGRVRTLLDVLMRDALGAREAARARSLEVARIEADLDALRSQRARLELMARIVGDAPEDSALRTPLADADGP